MTKTPPTIICEDDGFVEDTPQWRFRCRYCKTYHYHSGKPDPDGTIGHHAARCQVTTSPYRETGYILANRATVLLSEDGTWRVEHAGVVVADRLPKAQAHQLASPRWPRRKHLTQAEIDEKYGPPPARRRSV